MEFYSSILAPRDPNNCGDTYLLIHDTLSANGFAANHPILQQQVVRFHVDAFPLESDENARARQHEGIRAKNQWFLVIECEDLQACLSIQPLHNKRTGSCGTLALQLMGVYDPPPRDILHRQTYRCLVKGLTGKAVLETFLFAGLHKYELVRNPMGAFDGRRHHLRAMLFYMRNTRWIDSRLEYEPEASSYLACEYRLRRWRQEPEPEVLNRTSLIKPGRFLEDLQNPIIEKEEDEKPVV